MPPEIQFLRPLWFLALIPLPWLLWRLARVPAEAAAWRGVVDAHLLAYLLAGEEGRVRRLPLGLLAIGWLLAVTALAGPVWERLPQPVFQAVAQRVVVLDISEGMNAQDVPPSRLARARFEVLDLLAQAVEGQTALIAYGAEPFVVSPLTGDADTIAAQVPDLETALMPVRGAKRTDLALEEAGRLLRGAGSPEGHIILITDSLERPETALEVAGRLRDEGYRVSVLGVGTQEGAPVPSADGGFVVDASGATVLPRLRPEQLRSLAAAGGGDYVELRADDADTRALLGQDRARQSGEAVEQDARAEQWREEGPWLLLALLPIAALGFRRGWLSPLLLAVLLVPAPADALDWADLWWRADQQGARAFSAGEHAAAAERFRRPDWRAAAQYRAGDYEQALETLEGMGGAEAGYNRGNALAHAGDLQGAIDAYDQVLAADPDHSDARHNRDLLRRLLEQQQEQQQEQQSGQEGQEGQEGQSLGGAQGQQDQESQGGSQGQAGQQDPGGQGAEGQAGDGDRDEPEPGEQGGGGEEQGPRGPGQGGEAGHGEPGEPPRREPGAGQAAGEREDQRPRAGGPPQGGAGAVQQPGQDLGEAEAQESRSQSRGADDADPGVSPAGTGGEPNLDDLLGGSPSDRAAAEPPSSNPEPGVSEGSQAMEHMLRRVPDDPGGLLRQRFLLQHLRRSGRLP